MSDLVPRTEPAPSTSERRTVAWIGSAVRIEGKVISAEDIMVDGHVDGEIEVEGHNVTIGRHAVIHADLMGKTVTVGGTVIGNVVAVETINLQATSSVDGDLSAPRLVMADGAIVKGRIDAFGGKTGAASANSPRGPEAVAGS